MAAGGAEQGWFLFGAGFGAFFQFAFAGGWLLVAHHAPVFFASEFFDKVSLDERPSDDESGLLFGCEDFLDAVEEFLLGVEHFLPVGLKDVEGFLDFFLVDAGGGLVNFGKPAHGLMMLFGKSVSLFEVGFELLEEDGFRVAGKFEFV